MHCCSIVVRTYFARYILLLLCAWNEYVFKLGNGAMDVQVQYNMYMYFETQNLINIPIFELPSFVNSPFTDRHIGSTKYFLNSLFFLEFLKRYFLRLHTYFSFLAKELRNVENKGQKTDIGCKMNKRKLFPFLLSVSWTDLRRELEEKKTRNS